MTDEKGNTATDSIVVNVRHPSSSSVDYWTVFDSSIVRRVDVSISTANWDLVFSDPEAKIEVPVDAVVFGEQLENIGFRMKGQISMRESRDKRPWKFNIDAYIENQEFHNLRQLLFTNNIADPSLSQEILAYDMMRFAGVPASHVNFVEFWIDFSDDTGGPIFWGVYTMVERVDKKFLSNRFGRDSKDGNLYKASHAQRGPMDLMYYGANIEDYPTQNGQYAYGKMNNEEEADYSDIINLCYVISGVDYETPQDFAQALEQVFNVDGYLRYIAVIAAIMNWDSYPNTGNNYYLFNNPVSGKFEWIPWDLNWGGEPFMPLFERGENTISPYAPLYENVFEVERYRRQYAAYLDLLTREFLNYQYIYVRAKAYHDLIAPYVMQGTGDKMFTEDQIFFPNHLFDSSWQDLANLAGERNKFIQEAITHEQLYP